MLVEDSGINVVFQLFFDQCAKIRFLFLSLMFASFHPPTSFDDGHYDNLANLSIFFLLLSKRCLGTRRITSFLPVIKKIKDLFLC